MHKEKTQQSQPIKECRCSYCEMPIDNTSADSVTHYKGKQYHKTCGEMVINRNKDPETFKKLDQSRTGIEKLYGCDGGWIVTNKGSIEVIHSELKKLGLVQ